MIIYFTKWSLDFFTSLLSVCSSHAALIPSRSPRFHLAFFLMLSCHISADRPYYGQCVLRSREIFGTFLRVRGVARGTEEILRIPIKPAGPRVSNTCPRFFVKCEKCARTYESTGPISFSPTGPKTIRDRAHFVLGERDREDEILLVARSTLKISSLPPLGLFLCALASCSVALETEKASEEFKDDRSLQMIHRSVRNSRAKKKSS